MKSGEQILSSKVLRAANMPGVFVVSDAELCVPVSQRCLPVTRDLCFLHICT